MEKTIGNLIEKKFNESGISQTKFAEKINRTPSLIKDLFERNTFDLDFLKAIGKALDYDFIPEYVALVSPKSIIREPDTQYLTKYEECQKEINRLLQENNRILNQLVKTQDELLKLKAR